MDNTNIIEQVNITDWEFTDSDTQYITFIDILESLFRKLLEELSSCLQIAVTLY